MKSSFNLEILQTNRVLNKNEQSIYRDRLRYLLKLEGLKSICLEKNELYVEYNPVMFNLESFKAVLLDIDFPLKEGLTLSSLHVSA